MFGLTCDNLLARLSRLIERNCKEINKVVLLANGNDAENVTGRERRDTCPWSS